MARDAWMKTKPGSSPCVFGLQSSLPCAVCNAEHEPSRRRNSSPFYQQSAKFWKCGEGTAGRGEYFFFLGVQLPKYPSLGLGTVAQSSHVSKLWGPPRGYGVQTYMSISQKQENPAPIQAIYLTPFSKKIIESNTFKNLIK